MSWLDRLKRRELLPVPPEARYDLAYLTTNFQNLLSAKGMIDRTDLSADERVRLENGLQGIANVLKKAAKHSDAIHPKHLKFLRENSEIIGQAIHQLTMISTHHPEVRDAGVKRYSFTNKDIDHLGLNIRGFKRELDLQGFPAVIKGKKLLATLPPQFLADWGIPGARVEETLADMSSMIKSSLAPLATHLHDFLEKTKDIGKEIGGSERQ